MAGFLLRAVAWLKRQVTLVTHNLRVCAETVPGCSVPEWKMAR